MLNTFLKQFLILFIVDFFSRNIDLIEQGRKNFRPQNTDDETAPAEQSDYVWDPEWFQESFINIPTDISSHAISTISISKDYVRVYPLTIDATPLNYNSFFPERTGNNSLNSAFLNHENLNGSRNLTQQDEQTPSHFLNEEFIQTIKTTEAQRSISTIQPNFTTPKIKKFNATTNNHTIQNKTLCCTKVIANGLSNASTSNKTIIQTTNIT